MRRLMLMQLLGMAALGAATGGCADNDSALFVRSVIALRPGDCIARGQPDTAMLGFGILDLAFANNYVASLLVGNQLARQGDRDKVRTETSRIALRGAVVSVRNVDGSTITEYSTDGAGFVDPGTGTEPGYGVMFAELIPSGAVTAATRVNAAVRVFGETLGGTEIESSELIFPITVCIGCLVTFPADAQDPTLPGECTGEPTGDIPCIAGQDDAIDCRLCAGSGNDCCDLLQSTQCLPGSSTP